MVAKGQNGRPPPDAGIWVGPSITINHYIGQHTFLILS